MSLIATAASRISRSSKSSRRIERLRVGEHLLADVLVDRLTGDEVDRSAEDGCELVLKIKQPEAQAGIGLQHVEQVDIAVLPVLVASHRAEDLQRRDAVALAHLAQAFGVAGAVILAGGLAVLASVLRLRGWMIGLGLAVAGFGAVVAMFGGYLGLALPVLGLALVIIAMKRARDAQRSDTTTLAEANEPRTSA